MLHEPYATQDEFLILDETFCFSLFANNLGIGMNSIIIPLVMIN